MIYQKNNYRLCFANYILHTASNRNLFLNLIKKLFEEMWIWYTKINITMCQEKTKQEKMFLRLFKNFDH